MSDPCRRRILFRLGRGGVDPRAIGIDPRVSSELGNEDPGVLETLLFHTHPPNLAEKEYIEWHPDSGAIWCGPHFGEIEPLLELLVDYRDELPADFP